MSKKLESFFRKAKVSRNQEGAKEAQSLNGEETEANQEFDVRTYREFQDNVKYGDVVIAKWTKNFNHP